MQGFGSNLTFYIQSRIFCELDLPFPSSSLCVRTACVWTEKEFTYVHPAHKPDKGEKKKGGGDGDTASSITEFSKYAATAATTLLSFLSEEIS